MKKNRTIRLQQVLDVNILQTHFNRMNYKSFEFSANIAPDDKATIIYKNR